MFKHTTAQVTSENKEVVHRSAHVESHEDFPPIPATVNRKETDDRKHESDGTTDELNDDTDDKSDDKSAIINWLPII